VLGSVKRAAQPVGRCHNANNQYCGNGFSLMHVMVVFCVKIKKSGIPGRAENKKGNKPGVCSLNFLKKSIRSCYSPKLVLTNPMLSCNAILTTVFNVRNGPLLSPFVDFFRSHSLHLVGTLVHPAGSTYTVSCVSFSLHADHRQPGKPDPVSS
jgi:hypothetical protein